MVEPQHQHQPQAQTQTRPQTQAQAQTQAQVRSKTQTQTQPQPQNQAQPQPRSQIQNLAFELLVVRHTQAHVASFSMHTNTLLRADDRSINIHKIRCIYYTARSIRSSSHTHSRGSKLLAHLPHNKKKNNEPL